MPGMHSVMSKPSTALTPLNTSPKLWFDASDTSTFTTTTKPISNGLGGTVTVPVLDTWTSKGTIPSITLTAGYSQGAYSGETLNGKNIIGPPEYSNLQTDMVYYDSVFSNNPWDTYYTSGTISLFVVSRTTAGESGYSNWLFSIGDVSPNEGSAAAEVIYGGINHYPNVSSNTQTTILDTPTTGGSWHVYCMTYEGTSLKLYQDNVLYKQYEIDAANCALTSYWIQAWAKIGEIVAYNYTNASLVSNINSYLKTKWGL